MKKVREEKLEKFQLMQKKASNQLRNTFTTARLTIMGDIKSFSDLSESMLKLRETFDEMTGRNQTFSPIKKKKDLGLEERSTLKDQECETDEEEC